jgi:hypothetical protein
MKCNTDRRDSRWNRINVLRGAGFRGAKCGLGLENRPKLSKKEKKCRSISSYRLSIFGESIPR